MSYQMWKMPGDVTGVELRRCEKLIDLVAQYSDGSEKVIKKFANDEAAINFTVSLLARLDVSAEQIGEQLSKGIRPEDQPNE